MSGQGFQFTAGGFVPLQDEAISQDAKVIAAVAPSDMQVAAAQQTTLEVESANKPVRPEWVSPELWKNAQDEQRRLRAAQNKPLRPRDVVKAARARVREIKQELRNKARLEKELKQLERLIAAADGKLAPVRAIDSARRSAS